MLYAKSNNFGSFGAPFYGMSPSSAQHEAALAAAEEAKKKEKAKKKKKKDKKAEEKAAKEKAERDAARLAALQSGKSKGKDLPKAYTPGSDEDATGGRKGSGRASRSSLEEGGYEVPSDEEIDEELEDFEDDEEAGEEEEEGPNIALIAGGGLAVVGVLAAIYLITKK
jgi:cobalamin biosynthesis Mg chelatase CobN